jgi:hypothetical protein
VARPRLPKSIPQSLRYKKPPPSTAVKAQTHQRKAETLRGQEKKQSREKGAVDPLQPHLQFLERMKALQAVMEEREEKVRKEYRGRFDREDVGPHEVLGHIIATLPKPRLDLLFRDPRIGKLNATILRPARQVAKVVGENERLQDLGITFQTFTACRRDLKIHLGYQSYKSAQALGLYMVIIQAAAEPKVKKGANWVQDTQLLDLANEILREIATHIIEEHNLKKERFLDVGSRRESAAIRPNRKV